MHLRIAATHQHHFKTLPQHDDQGKQVPRLPQEQEQGNASQKELKKMEHLFWSHRTNLWLRSLQTELYVISDRCYTTREKN